MKWCNKGTHFVERDGFSAMSRNADGLQPTCRDCRRAYREQNADAIKEKKQQYRDNNKTKIKEQNARCYAKCDKQKRLEMTRQWKEQNPERYKQITREYYLQNREKLLEYSHTRFVTRKPEMLAQQKARYEQNKDVILAKQKAYNVRNRDKILLNKKIQWQRFYADPVNRQKHKERGRIYNKQKPEMRRSYTAKYRATLRQVAGHFTPEQWKAKLLYYGFRCYLCHANLQTQPPHVEHRKPISRGGTNWIANVAPACASCNLRKGDKTEREYFEWLQFIS